jgi:WD40 repeat protein
MQSGEAKRSLEVLTSVDLLTARVGHAHASALIAQTLNDFVALNEKVPAKFKAAAMSWRSFWATIEARLLEVSGGPRPEEARLILLQLLADTLGPPRDALREADRAKLSWRLLTGRRAPSSLLRTLQGHTNSVLGALVLADDRILSWSYDETLRLWAGNGASWGKLKGHTNSVTGALALPNGRLLSWSADRSLRLWARDGAPLGELKGHTNAVYGALALADGRLLSWSDDERLHLWADDGAPLQPWLWPYNGVTKVVPHAKLTSKFWVLAGNNVLLVSMTHHHHAFTD